MTAGRESLSDDRERREFYYVEDDGRSVRKVTGCICEGVSGYWWCPDVGVSAREGYSLFRDRVDAYDAAYHRARHAVSQATANLNRIEAERHA